MNKVEEAEVIFCCGDVFLPFLSFLAVIVSVDSSTTFFSLVQLLLPRCVLGKSVN